MRTFCFYIHFIATFFQAVRQIISRLSRSEKEETALVDKLEGSCRKFDHKGKGSLTPDEYFNVLKLQNGIDCTKDEVLVKIKFVTSLARALF